MNVPLPPGPPYVITCWDLATTDGRKGWQVCKHSAKYRCDLRVVGLTDYRLDAWRRGL